MEAFLRGLVAASGAWFCQDHSTKGKTVQYLSCHHMPWLQPWSPCSTATTFENTCAHTNSGQNCAFNRTCGLALKDETWTEAGGSKMFSYERNNYLFCTNCLCTYGLDFKREIWIFHYCAASLFGKHRLNWSPALQYEDLWLPVIIYPPTDKHIKSWNE